ncbi:Stk1 family PASTA domain-containing Ser/Thr kinase [Hamadaea tsunoensis]|uniref:Stk1 family PASTA domain-containing Ser/Thr kinase n=1 Tax=Hamadaea tsunoensis TaxID=53368 RepID=UPI00040B6505|nr:Stk1 family PASTA domain-containing Ser/Thr kinase [Hamadaea tsunoensis]
MSDQTPQPDDPNVPTEKMPSLPPDGGPDADADTGAGGAPGAGGDADATSAGGEGRPDAEPTQAMPAVDDADDRTQVVPPAGAADPTQALPPVETGAAGEPTTVLPGAAGWSDDATRVSLPEDAWTGRAEVRPAGPGEEPAGEEWAEDESGRRWWLPLVIGIIGVLVVIAIILAIVLVRRNSDETPSPVVSTPAAASSAPASPSPQPSPSPSPLPSSAGPTSVTVVVPNLVGHSLADATSQLTTLGLTWTIDYQDSTQQPDGYVLATSPTADSVMSPGQSVRLIVARAPQPSSPAPSPASSSAAPSVAAS